MSLETYFSQFRQQIVGIDLKHDNKDIIYADWTASGRLYRPIESFMTEKIGPLVANTHTEASFTGCAMTNLYHEAQQIIKKHVNADESDALICSGAGMTSAVNKFQRILGLKLPEKWSDQVVLNEQDKPVVFITHMEHHSNHTSWLETICEVVVVAPDEHGLVSVDNFENQVIKYPDRVKYAAITACSNVTGIETPYFEIAELMHAHAGFCFVDFACSAPYVSMNMHPEDSYGHLDAIYFSPHKFLGGPGSCGVLIFNQELYENSTPDISGGGTISWTNPWGGR